MLNSDFMKRYIIVLIAFALSYFAPHYIKAQNKELAPIEVFQGLKRIISGFAVHPKDTSDNKYIAYTYEVRFAKEGGISISYTEGTPLRLRHKQAEDEGHIKDYMSEENIRFDEELIILYPIVMEWRDGKDRKNNLSEIMDSLFDECMYFNSNIRIENPLVIYLGEVIINKKITSR
jgi:hypothetical protein